MHQVGIVVAAMFNLLKITSGMFCSCVLLQKGVNKRVIAKEACEFIEKGLNIVYVCPPDHDRNRMFLSRLFSELTWIDEDSEAAIFGNFVGLPEPTSKMKVARKEARERLSVALAASEFRDGRVTKFLHYCHVGCHDSVGAAKADIIKDIKLAHLDLSVPVPALNRWTKLYAPLAYWHVGTVLGYFQHSFKKISAALDREGDAEVLSVDALIGMEEEQTYKAKKRLRFKKSAEWLHSEHVDIKQGVSKISSHVRLALPVQHNSCSSSTPHDINLFASSAIASAHR
jgi:hypothetical protein